MTHTVTAGDRKITYELTRKKVKNINLRIKPDGTVHVSASTAVTIAVIERFIRKSDAVKILPPPLLSDLLQWRLPHP